MTLEMALDQLRRRGLAAIQGDHRVMVIDPVRPCWDTVRPALAEGESIIDAVERFVKEHP